MTDTHESTGPSKGNDRAETAGVERRVNGVATALDARLSSPLAPLEKSLDNMFGEKASYQLPTGFKDFLVMVAPWLSLLSGVVGLFAALNIWRMMYYINQIAGYVDMISPVYGEPAHTRPLGFLLWVALAMIVLFSVLAFLAFPGLRARKKVGWNIMFYSMLVSALYTAVTVISGVYYGGAFGSLIGSLVGVAIGLYLLFQVRLRYTASDNAS